jgi:hypothetical protein
MPAAIIVGADSATLIVGSASAAMRFRGFDEQSQA